MKRSHPTSKDSMTPKPKKRLTALARRQPSAVSHQDVGELGPIERLARDPKLTVEKLERLIAAKERLDAAKAAAAYWKDFDAMREYLPIIKKRGIVRGKADERGKLGPIQSRFAKFEDIQAAVNPVLKRFGFVASYRTDWPAPATLCVVCRLTHRGGHFEESRFQSPADDTGGKNKIQGLGSANSYGKRYTIKDILNLEEQGVDDDGNLAGVLERKPDPPAAGVIDVQPVTPAGRAEPDPKSREPITQPQLQRLKAIIKSSGRIERDVLIWIGTTYGVKKISEVTRGDYDRIVQLVESPADLPRQPGEEG